jgi:hypothetical protein
MNQCAGHVLRALPRSVDATADAAEGAVRGVRHVDKTVTQCNDEDRDDLLAPLTLEFCTSLRTLLMRDIAFSPRLPQGVWSFRRTWRCCCWSCTGTRSSPVGRCTRRPWSMSAPIASLA